MEGSDLKAFRVANNLTQTQLGHYLGIQKGFISKIENGKEKLPATKFQKLIGNPHNWDTTMLRATLCEGLPIGIGGTLPRHHQAKLVDVVSQKQDGLHTSYLQRKVEDQEKLIRELYQKIGMLEAKLELASKGDEV